MDPAIVEERVKETNLARQCGRDTGCLVLIASKAGVNRILIVISAALGAWDEMVDSKFTAGFSFSSAAVAAGEAVFLPNMIVL